MVPTTGLEVGSGELKPLTMAAQVFGSGEVSSRTSFPRNLRGKNSVFEVTADGRVSAEGKRLDHSVRGSTADGEGIKCGKVFKSVGLVNKEVFLKAPCLVTSKGGGGSDDNRRGSVDKRQGVAVGKVLPVSDYLEDLGNVIGGSCEADKSHVTVLSKDVQGDMLVGAQNGGPYEVIPVDLDRDKLRSSPVSEGGGVLVSPNSEGILADVDNSAIPGRGSFCRVESEFGIVNLKRKKHIYLGNAMLGLKNIKALRKAGKNGRKGKGLGKRSGETKVSQVKLLERKACTKTGREMSPVPVDRCEVVVVASKTTFSRSGRRCSERGGSNSRI